MKLVENHNLKGVFPSLNNITISGLDQEDHDVNFSKFMEAAQAVNLKFNESKSVLSSQHLRFLGYVIEDSMIYPDPDRLRPLQELPLPHNTKPLH